MNKLLYTSTCRIDLPERFFWIGEAAWSNGFVFKSYGDTKEQAIENATSMKKLSVLDIPSYVLNLGGTNSGEGLAFNILGNSYLEQYLPHWLRQTWTVYVVCNRFNAFQWSVIGLNNVNPVVKPIVVNSEADTVQDAIKNCMRQFYLEASDGVKIDLTVDSKWVKINEWYKLWLKVLPSKSIREYLILPNKAKLSLGNHR